MGGSTITINDTSFRIDKMSSGDYCVYDAGRTKFLGRRCKYASAVALCEELAGNGMQTCRNCNRCRITTVNGYAQQHYCELHKELLHSLTPCEGWVRRKGDE